MSLHTFSLDEKLEVIEMLIRAHRVHNGVSAHTSNVLKAIALDIRARQEFPRNVALGELERTLRWMKDTRDLKVQGYEPGKMAAVASIVINRWPLIQQALERYGEETAE